jgi:hypothetical protein
VISCFTYLIFLFSCCIMPNALRNTQFELIRVLLDSIINSQNTAIQTRYNFTFFLCDDSRWVCQIARVVLHPYSGSGFLTHNFQLHFPHWHPCQTEEKNPHIPRARDFPIRKRGRYSICYSCSFHWQ